MSRMHSSSKESKPGIVKPARKPFSVQQEVTRQPLQRGGQLVPSQVLNLQSTVGNRAVQRALNITGSKKEAVVQRHVNPQSESYLSQISTLSSNSANRAESALTSLSQIQTSVNSSIGHVADAVGSSRTAQAYTGVVSSGFNPPMPQGQGGQTGGSTSGGENEVIVPAAGGI